MKCSELRNPNTDSNPPPRVDSVNRWARGRRRASNVAAHGPCRLMPRVNGTGAVVTNWMNHSDVPRRSSLQMDFIRLRSDIRRARWLPFVRLFHRRDRRPNHVVVCQFVSQLNFQFSPHSAITYCTTGYWTSEVLLWPEVYSTFFLIMLWNRVS